MAKRILVVIVCAALALSAGCSRPDEAGKQAEDDAAKPAAKGSRVLRAYSALDPNETKIYFRAYEEQTGVRIQWVRMSSGAVMARVTAERKNPTMGLWFGGPSTDFIHAAKQGLLEPFKPEIDFELPPNAHDPGWHWSGFYFGAIGFVSNTNIMKKRGLTPPTSWQDLIRPEFKGEIGVAYPYTSGTAYTFLAAIVQMMGEEAGLEYLKKLDRNVHHYNKSGSACVTQVGLGEIGVGISFSHDIMKKGVSKGYPVALSFPKEGTGYEIGGMALIKGGPDHEEARKFIEWVLSVEAQSMLKNWFRIPLHPEAEIAEGAVRAEDVKLIEFDEVKAGEDKERLVEEWRLITAQ
ncbi:MAG: ABC transporter substrate-binding protein [bacterium]